MNGIDSRAVLGHGRAVAASRVWTRSFPQAPPLRDETELLSAIGYIRTDISGVGQVWDEEQMRCAADDQGYDLRKTIAFSATTFDPVARLTAIAADLGVDAVLTPSFAHLGDVVPERLIRVCAVVVVDPLVVYPRFDPQMVS
ncbi:hypothetical protein [Nocardia thailandica]|uniref:hypothetical protein n=1 Tax=Nocardia thailandica TaxID=257275 RepID=UPI0003046767|nr:hypothetical protein [Nocardia thailandica]